MYNSRIHFAITTFLVLVTGCSTNDRFGNLRLTGSEVQRWLSPNMKVAFIPKTGDSGYAYYAQWLDAKGREARRLVSDRLRWQKGFAYERRDDTSVFRVYSLHGDWQVDLSGKGLFRRDIKVTPNSRVVIHQKTPELYKIGFEAFVDGKLVASEKTLDQYLTTEVNLNTDGSSALLAWKSGVNSVPEVYVYDSSGKFSFNSDCNQRVINAIAGPNGESVLLTYYYHGKELDVTYDFVYYSQADTVSTYRMKKDLFFVDWIPGTHTAVFRQSREYDPKSLNWNFHAIDFEKGEMLWESPSPVLRPHGSMDLMVTGHYLLLSSYSNDAKETVYPQSRTLWAFGLKDGQLQAYLPLLDNSLKSTQTIDIGWLYARDGKSYFVGSDTVFAISVEDIANLRNGWQVFQPVP